MNLDFIAKLIDLVERSRVNELELTEGESRVHIVKRANASAQTTALAQPSASGQGEALSGAGQPGLPAVSDDAAGPTRHEICAGFPGTFYRAPAPDQPPYAVVGAAVEEGQQLAILEAMKTMNPVEADIAGTIREITVDDATAVEAGTLLFVLEPHP